MFPSNGGFFFQNIVITNKQTENKCGLDTYIETNETESLRDKKRFVTPICLICYSNGVSQLLLALLQIESGINFIQLE